MMLHAKFQDHQTSGFEEESKGFYHICWLRLSCQSCDLDLIKIPPPLSHGAPNKFDFDWPSDLGEEDL